MMNWILLVMAGIAAAVVAIVVGGLVTPARFRVHRRIALRAAPPHVLRALHESTAWPVWTERALNVSVCTAPLDTYRLVITGDDGQPVGSFAFAVRSAETGTVVDCTEEGVMRDPLRRFLRTHVIGLGGNAEAALRSLAEQLDEFDRAPIVTSVP